MAKKDFSSLSSKKSFGSSSNVERYKNLAPKEQTTQQKMDDLWVESTAPNVLPVAKPSLSVNVKPINVSDFVSGIKAGTIQAPTTPYKPPQNAPNLGEAYNRRSSMTTEDIKKANQESAEWNEKTTGDKIGTVVGKTIATPVAALAELGAGVATGLEGAMDFGATIGSAGVNILRDARINRLQEQIAELERNGKGDSELANKLRQDIIKIENNKNVAEKTTKKFVGEQWVQDYVGKPVRQFTEEYSYLPSKAGEIIGGAGAILPSVANAGSIAKSLPQATTKLGQLGTKIATMLPFAAQAAGSSSEEAINEGASLYDATKYGLASGAIEAGVEMISGGIGGLAGGKIASSKLSKEAVKRISNNLIGKYALKLADAGIDMAGEGFEEVLSTAINPYLKRLTYDERAELASNEELTQSFIDGVLTSLLLKGGQGALSVIANKKANAEIKPNLTQNQANEQQNIQPQQTIQPNQNNAKNQLKNDINNLNISQDEKQNLIETLNSTELNTETEQEIRNIINTIKSESLSDITSSFEANKPKYNQYQNAKIDNKILDNAKNTVQTKDGRRTKEQWLTVAKNLANDIYNMPDSEVEKYAYKSWIDSRPNAKENLNRQGKGYTKFTMDEWVNTIYRNVKELRNRTQAVAEKVDATQMQIPTAKTNAVYNTAKQLNVDTQLANRVMEMAKLTEVPVNGFVDVNENIDGYYKDGAIYINKNSKKAQDRIFVHELTHNIEKADGWQGLRDTIFNSNVLYNELAEKGQTLEEYRQLIKDRYAENGIELNEDDVDREVIAKFAEEHLLKDQKSIDRMVQENPTFMQRVKNFIDDLVVKFKGTAEEKELLRIQRMYDKAFAESKQTQNNVDKQTEFSISESQEETLKRLNEDWELYNKVREDSYNKRDNVKKQYFEMINNQEYKQALNHIKTLKDTNEIQNSKEYQLIVEADRLNKKAREYQEEIDTAYAEMERISLALAEEEKSHREPSKAIKQAKKSFGTTTNFKEAGYLLQDGSLLDLSGKNQGGTPGRRSIDHREINEVGYDMSEFIDLGNIRLQPESNGFELMHEPTEKQYETLKKYIENANGEVFIDIYKSNKMAQYDSKEYSKNTSATKIISDIQHYFKNGSFPYESDIQKFRYSINTDNQGRELSKQQQEFFKDSKVRDENGKLQVLYHGTTNKFSEFNKGTKNGWLGKGIYFTTNKNYAKEQGKNVIEAYINLKKPFISKENSPSGFLSEVKEIYPNVDEYKVAEVLKEKGYDGIIYTHWDKDVGTIINVFEPNQIKNIDNTNPTENPDIRYSVETREVDFPEKVGDRYLSRHAKTLAESGVTMPETVDLIEKMVKDGSLTHERITDKKALAYAEKYIEENGFKDAVEHWNHLTKSNRELSKEELALGQLIFNTADTNQDVQLVKKMIADLVVKGTQAGRSLQAMSMVKKMTPDGRLYSLERTVQKLNQDLREQFGKDFKDIEIPDDLAEKLLKSKTTKETDAAVEEIQQYIADRVPATWGDKANAWRYLAMLGNPRTHIRNVLGNAVFIPAVEIKNLIATGIEKTLPKAERTKAVVGFKDTDLLNFAESDFDTHQEAVRGENKYDITAGVQEKQRVFNNKVLETLRKKNFELLEKEDATFLKYHYKRAMASALKAKGITLKELRSGTPEAIKKLDQVRQYAINEAQKATYRDFNSMANWVSSQKRRLKRASGTSKAAKVGSMVAEGIIPFTKTPANILKRGIEYSPVGLGKGIYDAMTQVKKGNVTASQAIDEMAAGLTGTGIVMLGALLKSLGLIVGGDEEKQKEQNFEKLKGNQNYALKIGNKTYTIDWMAPSSMPLFVGVEVVDLLEAENISDIIGSIGNITDPVFELSMLQGLNSTMNTLGSDNPIAETFSNTVESYFGQYNPTFLGQIARTIDPKRRTTYADKNSIVPSSLQTFAQKQLQKIPFASKALPTYKDQFGRESETENVVGRIFSNFMSPGYLADVKDQPVENELTKLYEKTGESAILPSYATKSITVNKEKKNLTAKEYDTFAKVRGNVAYDNLEKLMTSQEYKSMDDEQKIKAIKKIYDYANSVGKSKVSDYELTKSEQQIQDYEKAGIDYYKWLILQDKADTNKNGYVTKDEMNKALNKSGLTSTQKALIKKNMNKSK